MHTAKTAVRALSYANNQTGKPRQRAGNRGQPAAHGVWRLMRGCMVGAVATGLAWVGHIGAGGDPPDAGLLLIGAFGITAASVMFSRYRWAPTSLIAMLLAAQVLLHELFDQGGASTAGHPLGHLSADAADGSMTVAHVLAAAATAWVLARGEDWLWLLLELLGLRATRLTRALPAAVATDANALIPACTLPSQPAGLGAWSLRGPPVVSK